MNREILFRGKGTSNGKWVYGYVSIPMTSCGYDPGELVIVREEPNSIEEYDIDPTTIGAYTGLTDDNGTKIYDGDILKLQCGEDEWIATVEFGNPNCEYGWGWNLVGETDFCKDILLWVETEDNTVSCGVIGNIHDKENL